MQQIEDAQTKCQKEHGITDGKYHCVSQGNWPLHVHRYKRFDLACHRTSVGP
jgi:hypothetical protein